MPRTTTMARERPPSTDVSAATRHRRRGRRWTRTAFVVGVALFAAAFLSETVLAARDARAHPAPGELVELVDGRLLHLDATARGVGGPTVVLEAGAGLPSSLWRPTVDAVLETVEGPVTVVAYDRAGTAWSGPGQGTPTPDVVVADLREALVARGLPGPYVLVGHSIGGHYVRTFAAAHPDEVAGVLLVDPRHEDMATRLPELVEAQADSTRMLRWGVRLRPFGITRLIHQRTDQLPTDMAAQLHALELHPDHLRGSLALGEALEQVDHQVGSHATDLGDAPVRIVSAGHVADDDPFARDLADVLDDLHAAMTTLSTDATRHVIADADHLSILTDPVHAGALAVHITDLLDTTR